MPSSEKSLKLTASLTGPFGWENAGRYSMAAVVAFSLIIEKTYEEHEAICLLKT